MQRSSSKILTTHVGSLPNIVPLDESAPDYEAQLRDSVGQVIAKQRAIGLDVVNEGEYTKGGDWLTFVESRFGGFEARDWPEGEKPLLTRGKDREDFAAYYQYATEKGILFYTPAIKYNTASARSGSAPSPLPMLAATSWRGKLKLPNRQAAPTMFF